MLENAGGLIRGRLVRQISRLVCIPHLDDELREALCEFSGALASFPVIDRAYAASVEVDFSWSDMNWTGRVEFKDGQVSFWATMFQAEGHQEEMCAQWQHTAMMARTSQFETDLMKHDPAHLWLWIRCFQHFVDGVVGNGRLGVKGAMSCEFRGHIYVLQAESSDTEER